MNERAGSAWRQINLGDLNRRAGSAMGSVSFSDRCRQCRWMLRLTAACCRGRTLATKAACGRCNSEPARLGAPPRRGRRAGSPSLRAQADAEHRVGPRVRVTAGIKHSVAKRACDAERSRFSQPPSQPSPRGGRSYSGARPTAVTGFNCPATKNPPDSQSRNCLAANAHTMRDASGPCPSLNGCFAAPPLHAWPSRPTSTKVATVLPRRLKSVTVIG